MVNASADAWAHFVQASSLLRDGVLVLNEGRIQHVNPSLEALLGSTGVDLEGQSWVEVISPNDRDRVQTWLDQGEGRCVAHIQSSPNGPKEVSMRRVSDGKHDVVVIHSSSASQEAPRRGGDSKELEKLRETDRFKTQLLNTAAHELNTPITPLRLQTHLLTSGAVGDLTEPQKRAVSILDRNVQRVSLLVKDILDVARMQGGNLKLEPRPTDVDSILADVFDSFHDAAEQVRIKLIKEGEDGMAVEADPDRLVQVMYNLISNALKFTPADGHIRVQVEDDGPNVCIHVQDNGVGLSQEQIDMLFKPFSQAHDPKDFAATGTGLGLYISKGIVESHGGSIHCTSEGDGKGSRFTVCLPVSHASVAERATATGAQQPSLMRKGAKAKDAMLDRLRELI